MKIEEEHRQRLREEEKEREQEREKERERREKARRSPRASPSHHQETPGEDSRDRGPIQMVFSLLICFDFLYKSCVCLDLVVYRISYESL